MLLTNLWAKNNTIAILNLFCVFPFISLSLLILEKAFITLCSNMLKFVRM